MTILKSLPHLPSTNELNIGNGTNKEAENLPCMIRHLMMDYFYMWFIITITNSVP